MQLEVYYITEQLKNLLSIPSPTGNTEKAIDFLESEFKSLNLKTRRNNKGGLIATLPGEITEEEITLSAHVDTLGAMVKEIKPNGRLKLTQIGGYAWSTIEGEYVNIETLDGDTYSGTVLTTKSSVHVHGSETTTIERNQDNMEIRLDEKVESKGDVLDLGINVGDFIHIDPKIEFTESGFIKSRHLDDKAGVVSILAIAKYFVDNNISPKYTTNFYISNYEEVGHGASSNMPEKTVEFLAIDMAAPGEGQTSDEFSVTICAKDSSGPYDLNMRRKLTHLAKKEGLSYKVDIYPSYGSDASAALRAGNDIRAGLIGPGVDASHSYERTHIEAIQNTVRLAILYLTN
ncbi:MAG TPA: M42 family metallopeptidase [Tissierellaceae bacterium]